MNRQRFMLHTAAISIVFLMFSASAWADLTGYVYRVSGNDQNASGQFNPPTNSLGLAATITGIATLGDLQFTTDPPKPATGDPYALGTLGDFLERGNPPDVITPDATNGGWLNQLASGNSNPPPNGLAGGACYNTDGSAPGCYSTEIEFTGTVNLVSGTTYSFSHDDGIVLRITGYNNNQNVLGPDSPLPTNEKPSSFVYSGPSGSQTIVIAYMATNGNPEDLIETEKAGTVVPEPSAVSMLFAMLVGVGGLAGILKKKLA